MLRGKPNPDTDGGCFGVARPRLVETGGASEDLMNGSDLAGRRVQPNFNCAIDHLSQPDLYLQLDPPPQNPDRSNNKSDRP